jgi:hypothetical protein
MHIFLFTYILEFVLGDDIFRVLGACDLYLELIVESDLSVLNAS